jgi:predicted ATP-grasp superfamily ATP-dependent carboligase
MNSSDFLLHEDVIYMLEINPRLSATLDLYRAKKGYLFTAHVAACLNELLEWPTATSQSRAHHIVYANQVALTPPNMDWPEWVCDIPQTHTVIAAGEPICSVLSSARTSKMAKKKVLERAGTL